MPHPAPITPRRVAASVEFAEDRALAAQETADEAFEAAIECAHDELDFDDVLEQLAGASDKLKTELMIAFRTDRKHFIWLLDNAFEDAAQAKAEQIASRRGNHRFAMVSCSQCGRGFGPGDAGFSDCRQHRGRAVKEA